jgi:alkylation response protein AidB-like acyl-CoA dehydrogenase
MDATSRGREDLAAWKRAQPDNLYTDDDALLALVEHHNIHDHARRLSDAGAVVAGPLHAAVTENNLHRNLPVLDDWSAIGEYTAGVSHHPTWRTAGRLIYGTGIMALYGQKPTSHRAILSLFYLTAQAGEGGHNCPLACDAGAIRSLQALGTERQQDAYLRPLLDPDFDTNFTASQFLTEVQGGSDVGANTVSATPASGGSEGGSTWSIQGEKWFCSNADADVFVLTARPEGAESGTAGLGLFLVPRIKPDGTVNHFRIRRLKDKLGTRSMASAEIDFEGAHAEALGPVDEGFKSVMKLVITTSRLYNAAGCAAHGRRAWVVASTYAQHRTAFGGPIGRFAPVRETLAWMRTDAAASIASTLWLCGLLEQVDAGVISKRDADFFRMAVNLNKMATAMLAHDTVNQGIEILGGNGAIESFSILPRLLRDNVVYENWEGTHNVLCAQVLRDCARLDVHKGFFEVLAERLGENAVAVHREELAVILAEDPDIAALRFRTLAKRLASQVMLAAMSPVAALRDHAALFARHLDPLKVDAEYMALIDRLQR